jgi:4-amino-4-deoxy-L-arabinose transferase-like glycosyltransferase
VTAQLAARSRRRPIHIDWALLAIFLAGLTVRAAFVSLPRMARWDEASYLVIARNLLAGHGYSELMGAPDVHQPPTVSLLAAAGLALHLPLNTAAAIPSHLLLGSLVVLPLYALGRAVYDRRAGLLAALLGALYPALAVSPLYWGTLTEPPYLLFILTGVYAAYRCSLGINGGARPWGWAALMGLAFGLGYLTRPESLLFLAVMLVYLGLAWLFGGPAPRRRLGRLVGAAAVAMAVLALAALPYVRYLHQATGRWVLSGKAGTSMDISWAFVNRSQALHDQAAASLDSSGRETLWLSPEALNTSITGWIAADPQRFATLVRRNLRDSVDALFGQDLFQPWLALLVILGLAGEPWTRRRLRGQTLLLLALAPLASLWLVFIESRFMVVYLAISLVWAGAGLAHLARWAGGTVSAALAGPRARLRRGLAVAAAALPVALVVAAMLWSGAQTARREMPRLPFYRLEAARWLAANTPPGAPIMTRNAETALYADRPLIAFPRAPWEQVLAYADARGAHYLVVDEWEISEVRPYLAPLLDLAVNAPLPRLTRVQTYEHPGRTTLLFRID